MVATAVPASRDDRLHALDGLRGTAAVVVFFYHAVTYATLPDAIRRLVDVTPLGLLCNGPGAVHVFFVLSGYVLALTLQRDTAPRRVPRYWVRRLFRIHPPYMAAVLVAWVASRLFAGAADLPPDLRWPPIPAALLPRALAFPSMAFGLLPVGWSLFVEMAMSAIFPLLYAGARRVHPLLPLVAGVALLFVTDRRILFLRFTIDFSIGLVLRLEAERVARAVRALPPIAPAVLALIGLAALQAPMLGILGTAGFGLERGNTPQVVALFSLGAGLLLLGTLHAPALQHALATRVARFFGRISYSFYLVHHTVLLSFLIVAARAVGGGAAQGAAVVLAFAASVALGELGWRAVEAPSIRAGRALLRTGRALRERASAA
jgi:peptidoglycan/LPS O-acetylase OafA/YrhL